MQWDTPRAWATLRAEEDLARRDAERMAWLNERCRKGDPDDHGPAWVSRAAEARAKRASGAWTNGHERRDERRRERSR